jgi:hypothetical protein
MSPLIIALVFIPVSVAVIYGVRKLYEWRLGRSVNEALAANEQVMFETKCARVWPRRLPLFNTFSGTCIVTNQRLILAGGVDWGPIRVEGIPLSEITDVSLRRSLDLTSVCVAMPDRSIELVPDSRLSLSKWKAAGLANVLNDARARVEAVR